MPARGSPAHDSCLSETSARIGIAWTACAAFMLACTACISRAKFAQSLMGLLGPKTDSKSNEWQKLVESNLKKRHLQSTHRKVAKGRSEITRRKIGAERFQKVYKQCGGDDRIFGHDQQLRGAITSSRPARSRAETLRNGQARFLCDSRSRASRSSIRIVKACLEGARRRCSKLE